MRRALTIDRHRFGVYDKQAASIMERFERIGTVVEMRQFLEDERVLAGCCLRQRLSELGHAAVQVALYNGRGWKDLSIMSLAAAARFKRTVSRRREHGEPEGDQDEAEDEPAPALVGVSKNKNGNQNDTIQI